MKITTAEALDAIRNNYQASNNDESGGFNEEWSYIERNADTSDPLVDMTPTTRNALKAHTAAYRAYSSGYEGVDVKRTDLPSNLGVETDPDGYNLDNWYEERGRFLDTSEFDDLFDSLKSEERPPSFDNSGLSTLCNEEVSDEY
tara:strand:+ start:6805 stop:7236 length:432 start_codon:yes stop_codon:yes gene_type:complete